MHDEVEGPWAPTGVQGPWGPVVLQELPLVPSCVQLGHTGIGHRQDCFHVGIPLGSEGGGDQVAPIVWSREDPWEEKGTGVYLVQSGHRGFKLAWVWGLWGSNISACPGLPWCPARDCWAHIPVEGRLAEERVDYWTPQPG